MSDVRSAAIDLGASTGRIVVAQYCDDRLLLQVAHRFTTPMIQDPETGYTCWDMDLIESEVVLGLTLAKGLGPIQSLGIDSWGVDHVLLDRDLHRVGPAVSYRDGRTAGTMAEVFRRIPAERIYRGTGIQLLPYQGMTVNWPDPAHLTLFKTEPLRGVSILQIPTALGLSMVDRLMGGSGRPAAPRQEMGAIENALLEQVAQLVADEWCTRKPSSFAFIPMSSAS